MGLVSMIALIVIVTIGLAFGVLFGLDYVRNIGMVGQDQVIEGIKYIDNTNEVILNYLQTKVKINEREMDIADLISIIDLEENKKQKIKVFQETTQQIFEEAYPLDHPKWSGVSPWWVRVYNVDEEPAKIGDGKYFEVFRIPGQGYTYGPGANCDPKDQKNNFVAIIPIQKINGNRVNLVLCIFKSYLKSIN